LKNNLLRATHSDVSDRLRDGVTRSVTSAKEDKVEAELAELPKQSIDHLRQRWRELFKREPPTAFGPDLLRRSIAYRIQENAYGGMDATTKRQLNALIAQHVKTPGQIVVPRRIKLGAILVRQWKGESHRVAVLENGFAYAGKTHESLSEIARLITGTRWNGPRFFGLRTEKKPQA
jgi:hypothetical protein